MSIQDADDELNAQDDEADAADAATEAAATKGAGKGAEAAPGKASGQAGEGEGGTQEPAKGKEPKAGAAKSAAGAKGAKAAGTVAGGADVEEDEAAAEAATDAAKTAERTQQIKTFRETLAKHHAAGDKKAYDKELRRLERLGIEKPEQVYGLYRELDNRLNGGGLVKIPGKDAKPDEVEAFHKALGVPEKAEDYLKDMKLDNGAVLGEADRPVAGSFAEALHKAGAPPAVMSAALNWYFKRQEDAAAELDAADEDFKRAGSAALKEEYGPAFKRMTAATASLFATAPGGTDLKNPAGLRARLLSARTIDGRILGDDPDFGRWLVSVATEINPVATVVEEGEQTAKGLDDEIAKIEKVMRENRREYNEKHAGRYQELLAARDKIQARQRA